MAGGTGRWGWGAMGQKMEGQLQRNPLLVASVVVNIIFFTYILYPTAERFQYIPDPVVRDEAVRSLLEREGYPGAYVILSAANMAYADSGLLGNMLCSFGRLNVPSFYNHFTFLPLDPDTRTYVSLHFPEIHQFESDRYWEALSEGLLRSNSGTSHNYMSFIIRKTALILYILHHSTEDILWSDSDLVWLKDPLPHLQGHKSCDLLFTDGQYWTWSPMKEWRPRLNAGFYFARNTENTKLLFETWYGVLINHWRRGEDTKEQTSLYKAIYYLQGLGKLQFYTYGHYPANHDDGKISLCLLDPAKFPKWEYLPDYRQEEVVIAHPNVIDKGGKPAELQHRGFWYLNQRNDQCLPRV
mmetsp:Transcript_6674/g.18845  ORF Transcript_6674/g.18845 Transcript_6674/m.18845 type:complete len:355 (-) Transcript_6674:24-1088(-)